jgi:hypothetical protein
MYVSGVILKGLFHGTLTPLHFWFELGLMTTANMKG